MSMIKCPECGNEFSDQATSCPKCGYPFVMRNTSPVSNATTSSMPEKKEILKNSSLSIWGLVLTILGCTSIIGLILIIIDLAKNDKTKKHTCSYVAIGVFVLYLIIGVGYNSDNKENTNNTAEMEPSITVETTVEETETTVADKVVSTQDETEETDTVPEKYYVGQTWNNDFLNVSYLECGEFTNYSEFFPPKDGNKIIFAAFEFENVSDSDKTVLAYNFSCYADGYSCEAYFAADDAGFSETLSSGRKIKGNVYFEVPENAKEIDIEYDTNFWTSENIVFSYSE